ncbi:LAGLIDADG family homing endonuclease, partial [Candidatus Aerophobetes bacterium]|nr:LAGLIDADG family homing endonuclease [Candidatus Aerophobetes bacterium]
MSKKVLSADNQQESSRKSSLNPWYISGFVEGEGTFHVAFYRDKHMKQGIKVIPEFHINQSYLRLPTLQKIKNYFNCGYIKRNHRSNSKDSTYVYV